MTKTLRPVSLAVLRKIPHYEDKIEIYSKHSEGSIHVPEDVKAIFKTLDLTRAEIAFDAGGDSFEFQEVKLLSNTYELSDLDKRHPKEYENILNILHFYAEYCSGVEIYENSDGYYLGEHGTIVLDRISSNKNGDIEIQATKESTPSYMCNVSAYVDETQMDSEDVAFLSDFLKDCERRMILPEDVSLDYENPKLRERAIKETAHILLDEGILPDGHICDDKEMRKLADIILKYVVPCKKEVHRIVNNLQKEGYILQCDLDEYDPDVVINVDKQIEEVAIRYVTAIKIEEDMGDDICHKVILKPDPLPDAT